MSWSGAETEGVPGEAPPRELMSWTCVAGRAGVFVFESQLTLRAAGVGTVELTLGLQGHPAPQNGLTVMTSAPAGGALTLSVGGALFMKLGEHASVWVKAWQREAAELGSLGGLSAMHVVASAGGAATADLVSDYAVGG